MAQFIQQHPWDPGYALPRNVLDEPPGRSVIHTKQRRRRSISTFVPYNEQYAIPDYVLGEPPGRGVRYTDQAHRRTIPSLLPQYLGQVPDTQFESYLKEGAPLALTLPAEVYALDGIGEMRMPKNDAIRKFGERTANLILKDIRTISPDAREIAFEAVLTELEPGLFERVINRTTDYLDQGMSDEDAVRGALASSISEGYAKEIIQAGKTGTIQPTGLLGLGMYGVSPIALEGFWSSIKKIATAPVRLVGSGIKAVGKVIGTTFKVVRGGVKIGGKTLKLSGTILWGGAKFLGKVPVKVVKKSFSIGKKILKKVAGIGCKLVGSVVGKVAAGAVSTVYTGTPAVGVAGATVASKACGGNVGAPIPMPEYPIGPLPMAVPRAIPWGPIAIGGAALLGVMLLVRR